LRLEEEKEDRKKKKPQGKNIMACPLLWAAIISLDENKTYDYCYYYYKYST